MNSPKLDRFTQRTDFRSREACKTFTRTETTKSSTQRDSKQEATNDIRQNPTLYSFFYRTLLDSISTSVSLAIAASAEEETISVLFALIRFRFLSMSLKYLSSINGSTAFTSAVSVPNQNFLDRYSRSHTMNNMLFTLDLVRSITTAAFCIMSIVSSITNDHHCWPCVSGDRFFKNLVQVTNRLDNLCFLRRCQSAARD
mmetsp:Transcript_1909/g.3589  ORF Transcript_1909/g.3589 Transcript_1909/m.3589 type:complete len:199 (-) Transcript_1909:373-969(-)